MIQELLIQRGISGPKVPAGWTVLPAAEGRSLHLETRDFSTTDPWSIHTRQVINGIFLQGGFRGKDTIEAGIGDGRNIKAAGLHLPGESGRIVGVDVDVERLELAKLNLIAAGVDPRRLILSESRIVDFLQGHPSEQLTGWGIACLPQAPGEEAHNHADGIVRDDASSALIRGMKLRGLPVDTYGLSTNAAFLIALRKNVRANEFSLLVTLSGRVPAEVHADMFGQTGWSIVHDYRTPQPIQQDVDTGVRYVSTFDDGRRFYESTSDGAYRNLPAEIAEERRADALAHGIQNPNVFHHVSVYQLVPGENR